MGFPFLFLIISKNRVTSYSRFVFNNCIIVCVIIHTSNQRSLPINVLSNESLEFINIDVLTLIGYFDYIPPTNYTC